MTILPMRIDISLSETRQEYDLQISQNTQSYSLGTSEVINVNLIDGDNYEGPYVVIPMVDSQTLETRDKHMTDDVLVREIPYYETSNIQNGITVFIADNLND